MEFSNKDSVTDFSFKARTHKPIFKGFAAESVVESTDSIPELADSITYSVIDGRLYMLNMFNILNPLESADGNLAQWVRAFILLSQLVNC